MRIIGVFLILMGMAALGYGIGFGIFFLVLGILWFFKTKKLLGVLNILLSIIGFCTEFSTSTLSSANILAWALFLILGVGLLLSSRERDGYKAQVSSSYSSSSLTSPPPGLSAYERNRWMNGAATTIAKATPKQMREYNRNPGKFHQDVAANNACYSGSSYGGFSYGGSSYGAASSTGSSYARTSYGSSYGGYSGRNAYDMSGGSYDTERIRGDLMDYYGTAAYNGMPSAAINLYETESATDDQLFDMAADAGFNVDDYYNY